MRIAVVGRTGQLALSLAERADARPDLEVVCIGRPDCDLLHPPGIAAALGAARPTIVVNAAAYTDVGRAETDPGTAFAVNAGGAGHVAAAAGRLGLPVIHISTDYVFDGAAPHPYREDDATAPLNIYGASKLAGEAAVAAANPRHLILRTAWLHSPFARNFVRTVLERARDADEIAVVADQYGNPTSALDLADRILLAAGTIGGGSFDDWGTYHVTGTGAVSRAGLARAAFAASRRANGPAAAVREITTAHAGDPVRRPADSCLSSTKFATVFGWAMPDWRRSVEITVERLLTDAALHPNAA